MSRPVLFGHAGHPHIRSIRFALAEKGVAVRVQQKNELPALGEQPAAPLGEPVLDTGGFVVRGPETVLRFVADSYTGPALKPSDPHDLARMNRALEIGFHEAVTTLGRIASHYLSTILSLDWIDPKGPAELLADARETARKFETILGSDQFLAGKSMTLADIVVASLLANVMDTPDGNLIIAPGSKLRIWWDRVSARDAFRLTQPENGALFGLLSAV